MEQNQNTHAPVQTHTPAPVAAKPLTKIQEKKLKLKNKMIAVEQKKKAEQEALRIKNKAEQDALKALEKEIQDDIDSEILIAVKSGLKDKIEANVLLKNLKEIVG